MYTCVLIHVSNKCKLRCVLMPLLLAHSHSHHVNSFAISLPVASRKPMIVRHCHSLKTWQLTLSSDKLTVDAVSKVESGPTATTLWLEPLLPHNPPDLSISTSPDSYPTSRWWHSILADVWVLLYGYGSWGKPHVVETNPCCHLQHLKSAINPPPHFYIPCNILHLILLTFNSVYFFRRWKSLEIINHNFFVLPKVMRCLPRYDHDSSCFLPTNLYRALVQNSVLTLNHS